MPIQIGQLNTPVTPAPPEWFVPIASQISQIASDVAAQTKAISVLQQQVTELQELIRQRIKA